MHIGGPRAFIFSLSLRRQAIPFNMCETLFSQIFLAKFCFFCARPDNLRPRDSIVVMRILSFKKIIFLGLFKLVNNRLILNNSTIKHRNSSQPRIPIFQHCQKIFNSKIKDLRFPFLIDLLPIGFQFSKKVFVVRVSVH
ncbi:hypothetical protein BpHYR1_023972 [Brachionus plicatilis]|uniref:Uncharacterized protein n=1 Tax=Brachionus plicatilis TaxID=10195 RepID=A0A3M7RWK7_BRAPC|nr:hypothetical protein BpHYR1_023972 [Brachionus plicatilis]